MRKLPNTAICLFLFVLLCASCGSTPEKVPDTSAPDSTTSAEIADYALPKADFDGETVNIYLRNSAMWTPQDIWVETENGDAFNDAVYRRNLQIEEMFNVKIKAEIASMQDGTAHNNHVSSFILADDASYDLLMLRVSDIASLSRKGLFFDLLQEKNLDFTQDCWQYDKLMETTVAGRLYYATGLGINAANALSVYFFNKEIAEAFHLENLYDCVKNGTWTVDKMHSMAIAAAKDLDGNSKMTVADQYGISAQNALGRTLYFASGETMIAKDESDLPVISCNSERAFNVVEKAQKVLSDTSHVFIGATEDMKAIWFGERALFYSASLSNAAAMRQYDFEFGVLPLPKFEEAQENYYCYLGSHNPCGTSIPITADHDRAALILQALAFCAQDELIPAYYDICLEGKSLRDDESAEMLEIIFDSWHSDLAESFQWGNLSAVLNNVMNDGGSISSSLASITPAVEAAIDQTVNEYQSFN